MDEHAGRSRLDRVFLGSLLAVALLYGASYIAGIPALLEHMAHHVHMLVHEMFWGIVIGLVFVVGVAFVPQSWIFKIIGRKSDMAGLLKSTVAGVVFDLCSHGILMIAVQLYKRGISTAQVIAFLVASPWNSLSLTIVLIALIGWEWTLVFIGLSMVVAFITGLAFHLLEKAGKIAPNPNKANNWEELAGGRPLSSPWQTVKRGLAESQMVMKWFFIGILIAAALKTLIPLDLYKTLFGPDMLGLLGSLILATILEVCSEGLAPVAADILRIAAAPGNAFLFLMAGVATDYTEIMVLREATKTWRIPLMLPVIVVPQVVLLAVLMNNF